METTEILKVCSNCKVEKPITFFYEDKNEKDRRQKDCMVCRRHAVKELEGVFKLQMEKMKRGKRLRNLSKKVIETQIEGLQTSPVPHLSYSAVRQFMCSPAKFNKYYINKASYPFNLTMAAGSAWHKGVELLLSGIQDWKRIALTQLTVEASKDKELNAADEVELAKELVVLERNLGTYYTLVANGGLEWHHDLLEEKALADSPIEGGIPLKGVIDVITKEMPGTGGLYSIVDHKYVKRFNPAPDNAYYVQAWFYYHLAKKIKGTPPSFFIVSEFKKVKNRDGSPQLKQRLITYDQKWLDKVSRWYKDVSDQIRYQIAYPPNPFAMYGTDDWDDYLNF